MKSLTHDEFIYKSNEKHNCKYDYSNSNYINHKTKIDIICPNHGTFSQVANYHLSGRGCTKCGGREKINKEDFIRRAKIEHGDIYDYSLVEYINIKTKVKIICPNHGIFEQTPDNHLRGNIHKLKKKGNGCPYCRKKFNLTISDFISSAKKIHGEKYIYDDVSYKNYKTKVKIICKKHGTFEQSPINHITGNCGCPKCFSSKSEIIIENLLKEYKIEYETQYTFTDLIYKDKLKFDFCIFKNEKLSFLIEYNGIQHYELRKRFHKSEKEYLESKIRDKLKIDYCNKNNIKLYIIKYDDNIKDFLEKIIKENE
jgi:Zn finger protein HypA/HybF involved in hydrogenase expression